MSCQHPVLAADLTGFAVGMWRTRKKPGKPITLLSLPDSGQLVFLVDRSTTRASESRGVLRDVGRDLQQRMRTGSPFNASGTEKWNAQQHLIVAFEVSWNSVVGIDWSRPLVHDGRLVLEAHAVVKRIFRSTSDAHDFYGATPALHAAKTAMQTSLTAAQHSNGADKDGHSADRLAASPTQRSRHAGVSSSQPLAEAPAGIVSSPSAGDSQQQEQRQSGGEAGFSPVNAVVQQQYLRQSSAPVAVPTTPLAMSASPAGSPLRRRVSRTDHVSRQTSDLAASPSKACFLPPTETGIARRSSTGSWPVPAHWTVQSQQYAYRSICCTFTDDDVAKTLRPIIEGDERLLRLYETGLQTWAIFLPQFGVFYRPYLRHFTWILFIFISVFSLATGFYDLYKHTPYVDQVLRRALSGLRLQAVATWLETHVKFRLSILLTYIFGNSMYFMRLLQWGLGTLRYFRSLAQPAINVIGPPLAALGSVGTLLCSQLLGLVALLLSPLRALTQMLGAVLPGALLPLRLMWASARSFGSTAAGAVRVTRQLASTGTQASQVSWWSVVLPMEVLRTSGVRVAKGLQSTLRFFVEVCASLARHRLTLQRRLRRRWRNFCAAVQAQVAAWQAYALRCLLQLKAEWTPTEPLVWRNVRIVYAGNEAS